MLPGNPPIYIGALISSSKEFTTDCAQVCLIPSTKTVNSELEYIVVTLCHMLLHSANLENMLFFACDITPFPISTVITTAPFCNSTERPGPWLDTLRSIPFCSVVLNSKNNSTILFIFKFSSARKTIVLKFTYKVQLALTEYCKTTAVEICPIFNIREALAGVVVLYIFNFSELMFVVNG